MRHNRKKNRSIFIKLFRVVFFVFLFSVFVAALLWLCAVFHHFFFFYLKGGGVVGFISKWEVGPTVHLPATVRPTGLRGIAESVFCQHVKPL